MATSVKGEILLVEDDTEIREILAEYLELSGYVVTQAKDGMEAIDILRNKPSGWVALITDIRMPRVDGLELIVSVLEIGLKFRTILITSSIKIYNEKVKQLIDEGKVFAVHKPYDFEDIIKILQKVA